MRDTYDRMSKRKRQTLDLVQTRRFTGRSQVLIGRFVQISRCGVQTQRDGVRHHGVADLEALLLVGFEHVGETETLTADVAGVRLLARVSAPVSLHVGPAREALSTDLTDIWFLSYRVKKKESLGHASYYHISGNIVMGWHIFTIFASGHWSKCTKHI